MRTLLTAIAVAVLVAGCETMAERLADKCYILGNGKAHVRAAGEAVDVECR